LATWILWSRSSIKSESIKRMFRNYNLHLESSNENQETWGNEETRITKHYLKRNYLINFSCIFIYKVCMRNKYDME